MKGQTIRRPQNASCAVILIATFLSCSIFDSTMLMIYSFWSPTMTVNFFRCSWLFDIKFVSFMTFCLKCIGLYPMGYTFLVSSELTTNIHCSCYYTVHVYVVIHFCESMCLLEWSESFIVFYRLFRCEFPLEIQLSGEEG